MSYIQIDKNKPLETLYQEIPKTHKSKNFRDITMLIEDDMLLSWILQYSLESNYSYNTLTIQLEIKCINSLFNDERLYKISYYAIDNFWCKSTYWIINWNLTTLSKQIVIKIIEDFETMTDSEFRKKYLVK